MSRFTSFSLVGPAVTLLLCSPGVTASTELDCTLHFDMHGWSETRERAVGEGNITCTNGKTVEVRVEAYGPGVTSINSTFQDATGDFTEVSELNDLLGTYRGLVAPVGADRGAEVNVVTKGEVSVALAGAGKGWDLGVTMGRLDIHPARE
jgi:hypothetical protein